ncbi:hypothetical protein [Natronomonas marina]|jgi:hypothetical protein|uniref:hypothetical protein n=1 Tax=Natronomonas marina TaxID=2961939 RepID=UPI0020C9FE06|nr:hypothetical protein [Natronomonas marina]
MTTTGIRTAAYVTGLTLVVGALGGLVAAMTVFVPLDRSTSLVEARLGATVVWALWASLGLLYLVGPLFLAVGWAREDDRWVAHGLVSAGAVLGLPVAFAAFTLGNRVVVQRGGVVLTGGLLLVGIVGAAGALLMGGRWLLRETAVGVSGVPLALVAVCLLAFVAVLPVATGVAADLTADYPGKGLAQFDVEERTTADGTRVVVFTHDGGDPLPATGLRIVGEGFADADASADQTAPGAWKGEASGEFPRREGDYVVEGDAVTVAVGAECQIRVVRVETGNSRTLRPHDCSDDEG